MPRYPPQRVGGFRYVLCCGTPGLLLAEPFDVSINAVSKRVRGLEQVGLVLR